MTGVNRGISLEEATTGLFVPARSNHLAKLCGSLPLPTRLDVVRASSEPGHWSDYRWTRRTRLELRRYCLVWVKIWGKPRDQDGGAVGGIGGAS